ncbi:hypothetical protein EOL99_04480 [Candidatus Falkowbacteria bacterium]|nr:hypothetical protein [Candidatus Falkowbacteria bacterium]
MNKILEKIKLFFSETKTGHQIKSFLVTFTGIFFGMLVLTPAYNAVFEADLPTIQEFKDLWPVVVDTLYRSIWAIILVQLGIYKYSSSHEEASKPIIK